MTQHHLNLTGQTLFDNQSCEACSSIYTQSISKSLEESREVKSKERTQPYVTETEARRLTNQQFKRRRVYTSAEVEERSPTSCSAEFSPETISHNLGLLDAAQKAWKWLNDFLKERDLSSRNAAWQEHCSRSFIKRMATVKKLE